MTEQEVYKKNRYKLVTMIGFIVSKFITKRKEKYKGINLIWIDKKYPGGFSLGNYIFLAEDMKSLYYKQHEYGHSVQLHLYGSFKYIFKIGIPSLISASKDPINHKYQWYEIEADRLGGE